MFFRSKGREFRAGFLAEDGFVQEIQEALELLDKAEKADSSYEPLYI